MWSDFSQEKKEKMKKEKLVDDDDVVEEKKKKKKTGKTSEKNKKKNKEKPDDDVEKAMEKKKNVYVDMPSVKMSSAKAEMAGIVVGDKMNSLPKTGVLPSVPPPITFLPSERGRTLALSDNTGEYAEILDTEPGNTDV